LYGGLIAACRLRPDGHKPSGLSRHGARPRDDAIGFGMLYGHLVRCRR
jgi:hypothetical protein